jgi:N-acetylmuramic acid 6-phosphate etherase
MLIVGLMSGTSLDGIDACLAEVHGVGDRLRVTVRHFLTAPLPPELRARLLAQLNPDTSRLDALAALNVELAEVFAAAAIACCEAAGLSLSELDAIGSHGQTMWHAPSGKWPSTLQLGEPVVIAARTGVTTVGNFRPADVALGGQGAPLVPYVDTVLFGRRGHAVALQNLGGIGNVTYMRGDGTAEGLIAFDTGPGNMVIDAMAAYATGGAQTYDLDGRLAASGRVDAELLAALLAEDDFLAAPPPKSTGRERYGAAFSEALWARGQARGLSGADMVATATAWTAATVADQYQRFLPPVAEVLVSGGGARNPALMAELAERLAPVPVRDLSATGVDPDAKEALAFAILAHQTLVGQPNVLIQATGAREPWVLGQIAPGRNFRRVVLAAGAMPAAATEAVNPLSTGLDMLSPAEAVAVMHAQDYDAVRAVGMAQADIARAVSAIAEAFRAGGRLFYVGAGTSGRLGVLDASECPPTFSSPPDQVQGLIAGGDHALRHPVEGAEDDAEAGAAAIRERAVGPRDVVVGISANGGAPYVRGALEAARAAGATTSLLTCNPLAPGAFEPDIAIVMPVGPEIVAGSTRLKAGTATKLALNMLSTLSMVRIGKVHDNLMVDVTISNRKLAVRARRLVERLTGLGPDAAETLLASAAGRVKVAVVMHHQAVGAEDARRKLEESHGVLRAWLTAADS